MEIDIEERQCKLKQIQRQKDVLNKRRFNHANLRKKDTAAAFYSGFPKWETFTAVYKYLVRGERGENISYWRSSNADT